MPTCNTCGAHVSTGYARVFADDVRDISACPNCETREQLQQGAAAGGGSA